ncbi:RlmF-related methyltransferase, partial [Flavobacteriaceae bacterium]|nr:RlmF-related methyltransferase [Flavobacteriaceae bacterium]
MATSKKPQEKSRLHPRNKNRDRYDLNALIIANPDLKAFVKPNKHGDDSVDFANPKAVKILNKALLNHYYGITHWDFPDSNLSPPIPGRADYIHYLADLLCEHNFGRNPNGAKIKCL